MRFLGKSGKDRDRIGKNIGKKSLYPGLPSADDGNLAELFLQQQTVVVEPSVS